jgi:hypothetical protein
VSAGGVAPENWQQEEVDLDRVEETFPPAESQGAAPWAKGHWLEEFGEVVAKMPQGGGEGQDHDRTRFRSRAMGGTLILSG